jgi:hypothetical protein
MIFFEPSEFECGCGCGKGYSYMKQDFLVRLDRARGDSGVPFNLTSAFRCVNYNISVGGKPNSAHRSGYAVDIACDNSSRRYYIINALIRNGFTRIGIGSTFVHADAHPDLPSDVIWTYNKQDTFEYPKED